MTETKNPRLVVSGDKIVPKGRQRAEVVRSVAVIVRMADGTDHVYESDEEVRTAPDTELVPSEIELQESVQREADNQARQEAFAEAAREQAEKLAKQRAQDELAAQANSETDDEAEGD